MNEKNQGGDPVALMLAMAKTHDRIASFRERGAALALQAGNGMATGYWREIANTAIEAISPSEQPEPVAKQWRALDEQGPRTPWRELDWRSEREVKQWEASHSVEYRDLYAQPSKQTGGGGETGWLIEEWNSKTGQFAAKWWGLGPSFEDGFGWSPDSLLALRFAREADAVAYIEETGWTEAKATEHAWPVLAALSTKEVA